MEGRDVSLKDRLAEKLPNGVEFGLYHVSTPPSQCPALFSAPPGGKADKTYCEYHSLLVTIPSQPLNVESPPLALFAIELQVYTTKHLTTVFVSKADSTGFAYLLNLPRSFPSILQSVTSTFVSWIIQHRHRPDRRLVISLFARSQNTYLFPGSFDHGKKHVLEDAGLVKWWCKTLDPVMREYPAETDGVEEAPEAVNGAEDKVPQAKAYLIVPGDDHTTRFFPPSARTDPSAQKRWVTGHPLVEISAHPTAPPRCLVPHFPDDPKARFLSDLDEQIADLPASQSTSKYQSPSKRGAGHWKNIKTLHQFWEEMATRQECSSGRLVGFLWIVFTPPSLSYHTEQSSSAPSSPLASPLKRKAPPDGDAPPNDPEPSPERRKPSRQKRRAPLKGPIHPRAPRIKSAETVSGSSAASALKIQVSTTKYYHSPPSTRGALVMTRKAYDRAHDLLLRLDFSHADVASASTAKWIRETAVVAGVGSGEGKSSWGQAVVGRRALPVYPAAATVAPAMEAGGSGINVLTARKKADAPSNGAAVNVLGANLVRKKAKT